MRFLVQKRRVRMYQTKHFPCGIVFIIYYWGSHHFGGLFISHLSKMLKWERNGSITETFVKNIMRVRIWRNPRTTSKKKKDLELLFRFSASPPLVLSILVAKFPRIAAESFVGKYFYAINCWKSCLLFSGLLPIVIHLVLRIFLIQSKRSYYDLLARVKPSYYSFKIFPLF